MPKKFEMQLRSHSCKATDHAAASKGIIKRSSVADPDPGSGAFLTSGSGIPDLGSRIPNPNF